MSRKRTYHTDILFRFQLGILPDDIRSHIPASTLSGWKHRDLSKIIGAHHAITEENLLLMKEFLARKNLLAAAKALWHIHQLVMIILSSVRGIHKIIRSHKTEIVEAITSAGEALGLERASKMIGISVQRYHSWKNKHGCSKSPFHLCRRRQPHQLTTPEAATIRDYFSRPAYIHWSAVSVYFQMIRDRAAAMSLSTFYKYVNLMELSRKALRRRDVKKYYPIRSGGIFQVLHMDLTIYHPLDHSRVYIYIIQDNFSRAILSAVASLEYSSALAFENLRNAVRKFSLMGKSIQLITDDGSENKGQVLDYLNTPGISIEKIIAQIDIRGSNSMIEAVNKRLKYDFLYANPPPDFPSTVTFLEKAVEIYNNKPLAALHGLTPNEALAGKIPDKSYVRNLIAQAKINRIAFNKTDSCMRCE